MTKTHDPIERHDMTTWKDAPNRTIDVDGVTFAYRELGSGLRSSGGVPAPSDRSPRRLGSTGHRRHRRPPPCHRVRQPRRRRNRRFGAATVEQMGTDAIAFIRAMGLEKVDLLGFSLGGGVAQMVALQAPELVRRMILAGTGPRGGGGIDKMATIVGGAYAKAALTLSDPRNFLFFPRTPEGKKAASDYFGRLKERTHDRDKKISIQAGLAQVKAIRHAGQSKPDDLSVITQPVFVANGDHDLMVDSAHSADMARRLPNAQLKIYPNSGHGGVFQHHQTFVPDALHFLAN